MAGESTVVVDRFLGLHMDSTDGLNIQVGELAVLKNIRITENYKMRKREGYTALFPTAIGSSIRGMWSGTIGNVARLVFSCGGYVYSKDEISGTDYASLDTVTYTNVDVVKTTAYASATAGTTGVDGSVIVVNSAGTQRTEVAQADIDLVGSVGKFYFHTDETVWLIVAKGAYANIAAARTALGTTTAYYQIGACANARTYFFAFNDKLYLQDGTNYKYWNGSSNVADVAGYVPKVAVATPPTGGGTPFEDINLLTGKKHQTFNGNNSATAFTLAETAIDSVDAVYVGGVLKTVTTHYTVNTTTGVVTFTGGNTPPSGTDNVDIYWTKGSGTRTTVTDNKQSVLFGGANDSRVFMYGKDNKLIYSSLADGVPSAEYFTENAYLLVGSDETDITHLSKQYDRLIVHKERDTHYCVYEFDVTNGASFPTYPLNDSVGNVAFGEGRNILNNPYVVTNNGIFQFTATNVRDEKNVVYTSQRVQPGLDTLTLSNAITFDWEKNYEYWVAVTNKVYIYNYKTDVWYYFELADTPSIFLEIDGVAYFGTSTGKIMKFSKDVTTDNGTAIASRWETGFMNFGASHIRKFLNFAWLGLQPEAESLCEVHWQSDTGGLTDTYDIKRYNLINFGNVDFGDFSFDTNYNPQPLRIKMKVKKFAFLKVSGVNDSETATMTIINLTLPALVGGPVK